MPANRGVRARWSIEEPTYESLAEMVRREDRNGAHGDSLFLTWRPEKGPGTRTGVTFLLERKGREYSGDVKVDPKLVERNWTYVGAADTHAVSA